MYDIVYHLKQRLHELSPVERRIAEIAGRLSTFNPQRIKARDLPAYDHMNAGPTFVALERTIVDLLELRDREAYVVVPLAPAGDGRFHAAFSKESLLEPTSTLILTASSEQLVERDLLAVVPRVLIASLDRIQQKVNNRLPGLAIHHLPVPPPAVPRRRRQLDCALVRGARCFATCDTSLRPSHRKGQSDVPPAEPPRVEWRVSGRSSRRCRWSGSTRSCRSAPRCR